MTSRNAAVLVLVSALAELAALAHHPVARSGDVLASIASLAGRDALVHGVVIAAIAGLTAGTLAWWRLRDERGITGVCAVVAYVLGAMFLVGAGIVDGFVTPAIAQHGLVGGAEARAIALELLAASLAVIMACTKAALTAIAVAIALFSAPLVRGTGRERLVAAAAAVAVVVTAAVLLAPGRLAAHLLFAVALAQILWYFAIASTLLRER